MSKSVEVGKVSNPQTKSFDVVKECSTNILVHAKLSSLLMVAKQLSLFLTLYQIDRQSWHFCGDMNRPLQGLLEHFIQPNTLKEATSPAKLVKLDVKIKEQHCNQKQIDPGYVSPRL